MKQILAADLFCGAGGASTGLKRACQALGLTTDLLAINHWPVAVDTHTLNHPLSSGVRHLCESIDKVNPREAVPGGRLHLLIAAPECTFFSTARGGRPVTDQQRTQPWVILKWLQELYVENLLIENVPEFMQWGPIGANGRPMKSKRGKTFRAFVDTIAALGYKVEHRILNAADYGDPTTRRRLFIIARRGNKPLKWPMPSHSRTGASTLFGKTKRWRAAREVIDWTLKGQSIFDRKRPLSPKTMARIMAGLERFGGNDLQPFLIVLRNNMGGRSLDEPLPTLSAQGQHVGLCEPFVLQQQSGGVPRSTDEPLPTIATDGAQMLIEPFLVQPCHGGGDARRVKSVDEPLGAIPCSNRFAIVEPFVVTMEHRGSLRSIDTPLPTITTAKGGAFAVVEPFLIPHYGERQGQPPRTHSIDEPVPTIPASGDGKFEVVQPFLCSAGGPRVGPLSTDEPMNTVLTRDHMALVEPFLASYYGTKNISPVSEPLPTITTKDRFALVMPVVNGRALDIRLRMLKPHELARAMSFGDDYQFTGTQGDKVKQIGNAIPCQLVQALVSALLGDYAAASAKRRLEAIA